MRNESDIFCLKELKDGEVDGTQMFSVSGQCPLKINRRRGQHTTSSTFEYGSLPPNAEADLSKPEGEPAEAEAAAARTEAGDASPQGKAPPKKASPQAKRLADKAQEAAAVTASAMARNPLTGAGMEIEEHRRPKKGIKEKMNKWVW